MKGAFRFDLQKFPTEKDDEMTEAALANVNPGSDQMSKEDLEALYGGSWENVNNKAEITIARLGLMQTNSPEVSEGIKGYEPGQIIDTLTREVLSTKVKQPWMQDRGVPEAELSEVHALPVLIVFKLPTEFAKWSTPEERKKDPNLPKLVWKTLDENDTRVKEGVWASRGGTWGTAARPETHKQKPPVTDCINFMLLPLTPQYQVRSAFRVGSFSRSSAHCGKLITGYINEKRMAMQPFWYDIVWLYTAKEKYEAENTFYQYYKMATGKPLSAVNPSLAAQCKHMALQLADKQHGKQLQQEILRIAVDDESQSEVPNEDVPRSSTASAATTGPQASAAAATDDPFDGK